MKPVKFNPTNVNEFENVDLEDWSFKEQEKALSKDPLTKQLIAHRDRDMKMKEQWSRILQGYLAIFTISMFATLWGARICLDLDPITLNFLITAGFAKVVGVVWIIVRHLFPATK
jgi:hypothetical protein